MCVCVCLTVKSFFSYTTRISFDLSANKHIYYTYLIFKVGFVVVFNVLVVTAAVQKICLCEYITIYIIYRVFLSLVSLTDSHEHVYTNKKQKYPLPSCLHSSSVSRGDVQ